MARFFCFCSFQAAAAAAAAGGEADVRGERRCGCKGRVDDGESGRLIDNVGTVEGGGERCTNVANGGLWAGGGEES